MISVESWPEPAARIWALAQRFQKFLVVGAIGFITNQGFLFVLHDSVGFSVPAASPIAILISMVVTFYLNEIWTWHDRGSGRILSRARSYVPINIGGLAINWGVLTYLHESWAVHYLIANLIGAAVAAVWNFGLNNAITWRAR
jgi:dolichol-phosphate mannosyltransferase